MSINAATDMTEGIERIGMRDNDVIAVLQAKSPPGGLGKRRFVMRDEVAGDLIQSSDDSPSIVA